MSPTATAGPSPASASDILASTQPAAKGRLMVDAPVRAFHWLFALSFAGAWLTAESEQWRALHVTLGYAFGGLLLLRLAYGLLGPRHARLSGLWRRSTAWGPWLRQARAGQPDLTRLATLAMAGAMLLLLAVALPLVLSGYAGYVEWLGLDDAFEELHELFANAALGLIGVHLGLIALLSVMRRKNVARPMLTGRSSPADGPGPDLVPSARRWLGALVVLAFVGFVGWQTQLDVAAGHLGAGAGAAQGEGGGDGDDDD
jgi:cytochrome b